MKIEELIERHEEAAKSFPNSFENHAAIAALLRELVAAREELDWFRRTHGADERTTGDAVYLCAATVAARLASDRAMESTA